MPEYSIDFNEVESFEPLPQDEYLISVEEVEMRESQSSDYPYMNWKLRVSEGEFKDRFLWMMTSLSPKALWRLKETLDNLEVPLDNFNIVVDEDTNFVIEPVLVGLAAMAPVRQEEYQGRIQNRVDMLLPVSGGRPDKVAPMKKEAGTRPSRQKQFK